MKELDSVIRSKIVSIEKKEDKQVQEVLLLKQNNSEEYNESINFLKSINLDGHILKLEKEMNEKNKIQAFSQITKKDVIKLKDLKNFCEKNNYVFVFASDYKGHLNPLEIFKSYKDFKENSETMRIHEGYRNFVILCPEEDLIEGKSKKESQCVLFYNDSGDLVEETILVKVATFGKTISYFRRFKMFDTFLCSTSKAIGEKAEWPICLSFYGITLINIALVFFFDEFIPFLIFSSFSYFLLSVFSSNNYKFIKR